MATIDFESIDAARRYKLVVSCLVPRPIAWVTTLSPDGGVNAAPFSFFSGVCDDPIAVAIGVNAGAHDQKDTAANIRRTGEFVVNMVEAESLESMNRTSRRLPSDVSEVDLQGIAVAPGAVIGTPRIASAPFAFECRRMVGLDLAVGKNVVIGQVLALHVRDDLYEEGTMHVDAKGADLVGRMHGAGWYARTQDLLYLPRPAENEVCEGG